MGLYESNQQKSPKKGLFRKYFNENIELINQLSEALPLVPIGPLPGPGLWQVPS